MWSKLSLFFAIVLLAGCTTPLTQAQLVGAWEGKLQESPASLTLAEDGGAEFVIESGENAGYRTGNWRRDSNQVVVNILKAGQRSVNERVSFYMEQGDLVARGWTLRGKYQSFGKKPLRLSKVQNPALEQAIETEDVIDEPVSTEPPSLTVVRKVASAKPDVHVEEALQAALGEGAKDAKYLSAEVDLDNDGVADAMATVHPCPQAGCTLYLFEGSADGKLKPIGTVAGVPMPISLDADANTWHTIYATTRKDDQPYVQQLSWDGAYPSSLSEADPAHGPIKVETYFIEAALGEEWGNPVVRPKAEPAAN